MIAMNAMMFGAANPDAQFLLEFILVLSLLGNIVWPLLGHLQRAKAQKREVTFPFEPASKKEFDEHVRQVNGILKQMDADASGRRKLIYEKMESLRSNLMDGIDKSRGETKRDIGDVHCRVNEVLAAVSRLEGRINDAA